jgi:hypothetical protein
MMKMVMMLQLDEQGLRGVFPDEWVMLLSYELAILVSDEQ